MKKDENPVFATYASYYDSIYEDKNYEAECDFIEEIFNKFAESKVKIILDLGCGTGNHAFPLARRQYHITGIDLSQNMINIAARKAEESDVKDNLHFLVDNIQTLNLKRSFDAVISMFAVLCYQNTNDEVINTLKTVRKHLKTNGIFICDFWYGPAVLKERPGERTKIVKNESGRIIRIASPEINTLKNTVLVRYQLFLIKGDKLTNEIREEHNMRYFFIPELEAYFRQANLKLMHLCPFLNLNESIKEESWNVTAIALAI